LSSVLLINSWEDDFFSAPDSLRAFKISPANSFFNLLAHFLLSKYPAFLIFFF